MSSSTAPSTAPLRRIRVLDGPLQGMTFAVQSTLELGRSPDADVLLIDCGVSRRHARIRRAEDGRDYLEDLDSTNGTLLDGIRIRRQLLAPQMVFALGRTRFVYEATARHRAQLSPRQGRGKGSERSTDVLPPYLPSLSFGPRSTGLRDPDAPVRRQARLADQVTRRLEACEPSNLREGAVP